jgi:hypothetical protein
MARGWQPLVDDGVACVHLVREGLGGQRLLGREVTVQSGGADPGAPGFTGAAGSIGIMTV